MQEFFRDYWPYLVTIINGLFIVYKFALQRSDTRIDRERQKIELIEKIEKKFTKNIKEFLCTEKLNIYFGVNFNIEKMKACMNSHDIRTAITIVKRYYNLIEVKDTKLIPQKILNFESKWWQRFSHTILYTLVFLNVIGLFLLSSTYEPRQDVKYLIVILFIYGMFLSFFIFSLRELINFYEAKKFFKTYMKIQKTKNKKFLI